MGGTLNITGVTGASPNWTLQVSSVGGAQVGDHVAASIDGLPVGDGAPFRIENIPTGVSIDVVDDLKSGGGTYGRPGNGPAQYYTPTPNLSLSQPVDNGPYWSESLRRDNQVLDDLVSALEDRVGWVRIVSVVAQPGQGEVVITTWDDPPNNTIPQEGVTSTQLIRVTIESSYPRVNVNGTDYIIPLSGTIYRGPVDFTLIGSNIVAEVTDPDGDVAAKDTVLMTLSLPPVIQTLQFIGDYPGTQSSLKEDDNFDIQVTTDKDFDQVEVIDHEAGKSKIISTGGPTSSWSGSIDAADRGDVVATPRPARVRVRDAVTSAYSATRDTNQGGGSTDKIHVVNCNNYRPAPAITSIDYPLTQGALKGTENATVNNNIPGPYDSVLYEDPTGTQLLVNLPNTFEAAKQVTRQGGGFNNSVENIRITAYFDENDSSGFVEDIVVIANDPVGITMNTPFTRLRSGGNDGTSAQDYSIEMVANQPLLSTPSLEADSGGSRGTFTDAWSGGPTVYNRTLQVHDDDEKGVFSWESLSATNLAGIETTSISVGDTYELGGFVARDPLWNAYQEYSEPVNVEVSDWSKVQADYWEATNQPAIRHPIGTSPPQAEGYTSADPVGTKPHTLRWLDPIFGSNTGPARLFSYEEVV